MNLLSLVTPWLNNACQIKTKYYSSQKHNFLRTKQGLIHRILFVRCPFEAFSWSECRRELAAASALVFPFRVTANPFQTSDPLRFFILFFPVRWKPRARSAPPGHRGHGGRWRSSMVAPPAPAPFHFMWGAEGEPFSYCISGSCT